MRNYLIRANGRSRCTDTLIKLIEPDLKTLNMSVISLQPDDRVGKEFI
ncbi:MAG: hypothetical protein ACI9OF_002902, partial [Saprospiraceae bacterium]